MSDQQQIIETAVIHLKQGRIIAYPTEAVYGLGCDPFNQDAVLKLLQLKKRSVDKGVILIASDYLQLEPYLQPINPVLLSHIQSTWPGPHTWIFPIEKTIPSWLTGKHDSMAVRVTDHPIANKICEQFGGPIISTSANLSGQLPARDERTVKLTFGQSIDYIVPGKVGGLAQPTSIHDAVTGEKIR
jgi:L-threonylcarbamoyladenylate synthase